MTHQVHQVRGQGGSQPKRKERPAPGKCNFPIWTAIDSARHIRICGNRLETGAPAGEAR
ncbi:MAG TPA: hypothetical protein VMV09_09505 [Candidatus Saccharimonadales bacterium]|nr:hypothetical protein [Candidatus Saccharimonadales bacterium]